MAIAANPLHLPSLGMAVRLAARGGLYRVLGLCRRLDGRWPAAGLAARRLVLRAWWAIAVRMRARLRHVLRGARGGAGEAPSKPDAWPDIAPEGIALRPSDHPVVSIIIPTYGQTAYTLRCLASIAVNRPETAFEVIVVDDAFPGRETAALEKVPGIALLRNQVNIGFIRSCNAASRIARGEFLLFLNNDTQVCGGWLDQLRAVFGRHADTGIAGSKLIAEDGTLQEAGGIVWNDGSAWNYGRGQHPDAAAFNYPREVDYCSGASIMVRRQMFLDVDGFDTAYAPAYCEDSDLSFRLRERGLKTRYQPRSAVIHHEGVSNGRDTRHGVKAFQIANQARFLRRWDAVLRRDHFPNGTHVLRAKDRARVRKVLLAIDHFVPEPDRDAGSRTMTAFLRGFLDAGFTVKFWPFNLHPTPVYTDALRDLGVEVFHGPSQQAFPDWLRANGGDIDLVLLSRPDVAEMFFPLVRDGTKAPVAYYGHDLHFRRMRAQADLTRNAAAIRASDIMRAREMAIWREVDTVLYPSEEEAADVRALVPGCAVHAVVPYALTAPASVRAAPSRPRLLFVAGFGHPPNAEAAVWFVRHVMPLVLSRHPDALLAIVGSNPPAAIEDLAGPGVALFANVSDAELDRFYANARVAVVPLLAGAGVKRKTVEALWHGVPLVTTPTGAQGLPGLADIVPVTAAANDFSAAVCSLLEDDALWERRSRAQMDYARDRFSETALWRSLSDALNLSPPEPACAPAAAMA